MATHLSKLNVKERKKKKAHCFFFDFLSFETSDGSKRTEEASLVGENLSVKGSFQYVAADGETYKVNFVADENGYRPEGAHIPVAAKK
jgi:hypothetical protein